MKLFTDIIINSHELYNKTCNVIFWLDTELSRLDDHIAEVEDKVECQVMKAAERDALREECAKLREEAQHYSNYLEKLQDSIGRIDVEMSQQRKKVRKHTNNYKLWMRILYVN